MFSFVPDIFSNIIFVNLVNYVNVTIFVEKNWPRRGSIGGSTTDPAFIVAIHFYNYIRVYSSRDDFF